MSFRLTIVSFGLVLFFPGSGYAAGESFYDYSNSIGGSGWSIYEDFQEFDEDTEAKRLKLEAEERKRREEKQLKVQRRQDFFAVGVDVYDESISRSAREEKKLKGQKGK